MFECIHYNIKVIRDEREIFTMEWMDSGVFLMGHFIIVISNSIYMVNLCHLGNSKENVQQLQKQTF